MRGGDLRRENSCVDSEIRAAQLLRILRTKVFHGSLRRRRSGIFFCPRNRAVRQRNSDRRYKRRYVCGLRNLRRFMGGGFARRGARACGRADYRESFRLRRNRRKSGIPPLADQSGFGKVRMRLCVRRRGKRRIHDGLRVCGALPHCRKRRHFKRERIIFGERSGFGNRRGIFNARTAETHYVPPERRRVSAGIRFFRRRCGFIVAKNRIDAVCTVRRKSGRAKRIDFIVAVAGAGKATYAHARRMRGDRRFRRAGFFSRAFGGDAGDGYLRQKTFGYYSRVHAGVRNERKNVAKFSRASRKPRCNGENDSRFGSRHAAFRGHRARFRR